MYHPSDEQPFVSNRCGSRPFGWCEVCKDYNLEVCEGCSEILESEELSNYICVFDGEKNSQYTRVCRYCDVCAELAEINWNGVTLSIQSLGSEHNEQAEW